MKKTVILSSNDNTSYVSYLPYVQKAWNHIGWNTLTFYLGSKTINSDTINQIIPINSIEGYRDETILQTYRLLAHNYIDGLIMTSDVDMIPLKDYWHPSTDAFTCYGRDLTHNQHCPMCYISATSELWKSIISENNIKNLLDKYQYISKSDNFYDYWFTDQHIITEKLKNIKCYNINRGWEGNFAVGRVDRSAWEFTMNSASEKIDAHMPKTFNEIEVKLLLKKFHNIE